MFQICDRQETERQTVEELRTNISLLEHEKREKAVDRIRYEKEIEQLEENWKKESQELLGMISRLQEDNKKLSSSLKERTEKTVSKSELHVPFSCLELSLLFIPRRSLKCLSPSGPVPKEPDWDLFEKLREVNEKQRDMLRVKDKEYQDKLCEAESVRFLL